MSKKKVILFGILYYFLAFAAYALCYCFLALLPTKSLGTAIVWTCGILFVMTPIAVVLIARFSLLKWWVDPFAALLVPLFFYISMVVTKLSRGASLRSAILLLSNDLGDDGGTGWGFLVCLFLLGLAASFSLARRKGKSISYRLLGRLLQAKT
jgi:hypothetical protein